MQQENPGWGRIAGTLTKLLGAGVAAGVLVAFIALPGVGSTGLTARDAATNFQNMEGDFSTTPPPEKTVVYDVNGKQIATFFDKYRESVPLNKIAPIMKTAIIDIEDSRFYDHGALDLKGTMRALATNVESGETSQGGSTLTQQYVKNLLVEQAEDEDEYREVTAPTVSRKLRELRFALHVEEEMSKDEILQGYMNIAYFGAGAYGVEAAAKRYFSVPAKELNLQQAALLAGITKNPAAYDPTLHPEAAKQRRDIVIRRMAQLGHVSQKDADAAMAEPIKLNETRPIGGCETSKAPFFCVYVQYEMYNVLSNGKYWKLSAKRQEDIRNKLKRDGYVIRTTLDLKAQKSADRGIKQYVHPKDPQVAAEAMVEPGTGHIKAMAASKAFGSSKKAGQTSINVAANWAHGGGTGFQAGSTFKAFTLATAIKEGMSPDDTVTASVPFYAGGYSNCKGQDVSAAGHPVYNSSREGGKSGTNSLRTGTWKSVNTFFMALQRKVGLCDVVETAKSMGVTERSGGGPLAETATFTLGVNEMDPVTVAAAFATFGARGKFCKPIALLEVTDPKGEKLKVPGRSCKQVLDTEEADTVNGILQGVFSRGTMSGVGGIGRPAAGKTGTNDSSSSAWFAGYTPDLAAAVSLGDLRGAYDHLLTGSGACMGGRCYGTVYGATVPGPIWKQSMAGALSGTRATSFGVGPDYGESKIPDVAGESVGSASAALKSEGFKVRVSPRPVNSRQPAGTVASTSPRAGTTAEPGATVTIFISNGRQRGRGNDDDELSWPF